MTTDVVASAALPVVDGGDGTARELNGPLVRRLAVAGESEGVAECLGHLAARDAVKVALEAAAVDVHVGIGVGGEWYLHGDGPLLGFKVSITGWRYVLYMVVSC